MNKLIRITVLIFLISHFTVFAQKKPEFLTKYNETWVENTLKSLTLEEKIGQLLMPRGNTSGKGYDPEKLKVWVRDYKIGGIVFFAGQPTVQARIVNELQAMSKTPLLIGMDLEWGLAMRLDSTVRFPYQMALGAMQGGEKLIQEMGNEIGLQCRRMGVHINYAPVVDINNNPQNPVINFRSFGEDKLSVTNKAFAFMTGLQNQRILSTAKHFPGHGDTGVDSHYDLPIISHDKAHLTENELFPYKFLIENGLSGVMTSHLSVLNLDTTKNLAATFSSKIVTDLLKKDLKFEGLTFTDAMDMQGAVKYFPNGEALVSAILAGNDILETFEDVPTAVAAIKKAIENKQLTLEILDERVRKILKAKSWVGLDNYKPIEINNLIEDLNTIKSDYLNRVLAEKSIVTLRNNLEILPIKDLSKNTVILSIDATGTTPFQKMASNYTEPKLISIEPNGTLEQNKTKIEEALKADNLIIGWHLANIRPGANYGINANNALIIKAISEKKNATLVIFGNPYTLGKVDGLENFDGLILANQLTKYTEEAAAMAVFGGIESNGRLSVTVNEKFKLNDGLLVQKNGRLSYGSPEMVGIDSKVFNARIDSVINLGIKEKAYPGAVMQVAKNGRVIYQKAFGFHTYEQADDLKNKLRAKSNFEIGNKSDVMDNPKELQNAKNIATTNGIDPKILGMVDLNDLYDFASVTKISTSALAVMQLMSENKFDLDKTFGEYYEPFRNSNKENLTFKNMLTHRSGLKAWIPFWMDCVDSLATIEKAVKLNPSLENLVIKNFKKQGILPKILKLKPKYTLDYAATLKKDKTIWAKSLNTKTITWLPGIFSNTKTEQYSVEVADTLFMNKDRMAFIMNQIKESPVKPQQGYVYSDLHYYTYPAFVQSITGQTWEDYLKTTYKSLGASTLTYNPRRFYGLDKIVPTEKDTLFRKTLIHGRVHDEGAGMLNGISGHAGLFGSANDLTKLMQMYLQKGNFGGKQYIKPEIVDQCTDYQFPYEGNRRGIAFEKLDFNKNISNGPQLASSKSYGHSGYTGTYTWVDPELELVYVFLSNRVYPTRDNPKISSMNIRTEVGNQIIKTIKGK
jgi:beta-N-acetylhexosaminidase